MFPGFGTLLNVTTVLVGSGIGLLLGQRLPQRTRYTVTDALGLVTLLIGALSAVQVTSTVLSESVGSSAPVLIVLGSLLLGGIVGSLADIEARLVGLGDWLRRRVSRPTPARAEPDGSEHAGGPEGAHVPEGSEADHGPEGSATDRAARARFIEGFLTASLVFCVGPLTILGALSDGLGLGSQQLVLKSVLDGFTSIAFAASLGVGVMASAVTLAVVQGALTGIGFLLGDFLSAAQLAAVTATGGLLLVGLGLRLLQIKQVPVGNLLPALLVAPLLVSLVAVLR